jgi:hypothetical protein
MLVIKLSEEGKGKNLEYILWDLSEEGRKSVSEQNIR